MSDFHLITDMSGHKGPKDTSRGHELRFSTRASMPALHPGAGYESSLQAPFMV